MSHEPWDDERLATAFTERARPHAMPPTLTIQTLDAVRAGRRLKTVSPWRPWMAATATVVVAVALVGVSLPRPSGPTATRTASPPAATAEPQGNLPAGTIGPAFTPSSVADLPVMTIEQAIAIRDAGVDDREIKVAGWLPPDRIYSCPLVPASPAPPSPPAAPLQPGCASAGDQLYGAANLGTGQTLRVFLGGVDVAWRPGPGTSPSTRVEFVGHFDDRRAQACAVPPDCEDRFVVDQVSSADGAAVPLSLDLDRYLPSSVRARWTPQELEDLFASYGQVLSMVVMPLSSLGSLEPAVSAFAREPQDRLVWRVQVLSDDYALTFLVEDVGDSAHEVQDDGSVSTIPLASLPAIRPDGTILGLPLIDVQQAAAIRDGGLDDQEIAVRGWLASLAVPCPSSGAEAAAPFGISCENSFTWLSGSADQPDPNGPIGPSIRPVFQFADVFGSAPQQAVLIGHFDDRRSSECPAAAVATCSDWFIVDRTGSAPTGYLTTYLTDATLRQDAIDVAARIGVISADAPILSMVVLPAGGIAAVEPSIADRRGAHTFDGIVWRAQVLEGGLATTYLMPDATGDLYVMDPVNGPVPVSGEVPSSSPNPPAAAWPRALVDGRLAVIGTDSFNGSLTCNPGDFPFAGLSAPTGAENLAGPEYDALRIALASPSFMGLVPDSGAPTWRVADRSDSAVVFLATKPANVDQPSWVDLIVERLDSGWVVRTGGDCQPLPILPDGYGPATWEFDPAYPKPTTTTRSVHLLVTETACASGRSADDRLSPAFVVPDPVRVTVGIGVLHRPGGQDCPSNPPSKVTIRLPAPLGHRSLVDRYSTEDVGTGG